MAHREGASFKPRPLGSHVAVRDGPSPARLTHCLAGADYRLEDPHRRGPCLQLPRRRWFSSSCGRFATNGVASLQLVDLRRSWVIPFQGCFEIGFSEAQLWWPCDFAGQVPSGLVRGGPPAVQDWHAMEFLVERSARSASGVLHLMPLGTAALCGKQRRAGGRGGGTVEGCFGAWVKWALCWFLCRSL